MKWNSIREFGHDALGPVINIYLARLHAYLRQCDDNDHKILFALRAGLRIHDLYKVWLTARGGKLPSNLIPFKVSRMMAIKAAYSKGPTFAITALGQELDGASLNEIIRSLLKNEMAEGRCPELPSVEQMPLHEFLNQGDQLAHYVRRHLKQQSDLYTNYLSNLAGDANRLILVDTGWQGSTQLLLEAAFPEYEWEGVYFGCKERRTILDRSPGPMHGLIFDSDNYQPEKPETSFLVHRHLIESLFEPGISSVEQIDQSDIDTEKQFVDLLRDELRDKWDDAYDGVRAYLSDHAQDRAAMVAVDYEVAIEQLGELLCYPSKEVIPFACGKVRSHDLGRIGEMPPVFPVKNRFEGDNAELRIQGSIWQTAQAALEYPEERARIRQGKIVDQFMSKGFGRYLTAPTEGTFEETKSNHIAIITRTKDRPLLLRRAAESVAKQTFEDYTWVIVNDGGNLEDVLQVLEDAAVDPTKVMICSNPRSFGMEAASNIGIRASESQYVVIHDDDDSWHQDFLKETIAFLHQNRHVYGGVVTKTLYVSEEILGDTVIEHGRFPFNDWVENVQLSEMVVGNFYAPIAFVFRRDLWEQLRGFDENLIVLGDWDFNIRFLMKSDIGVLPKALAYYHHRDCGNNGKTYSNSVIGGRERHVAYNAIVRNKYIRLAGTQSEYATLGVLIGSGLGQQEIRYRIDNAREQILARSMTIPQDNNTNVEAYNQAADKTGATARKLQDELDRRWVMLHVAASVIIREKGLSLDVPTLIEHIDALVDGYIKSTAIDPPPDFNEAVYLDKNRDVLKSIQSGNLRSGFEHYIRYGRAEGRLR